MLVVDSGGRGHEIAWQFKSDPNVREVICAPGNAEIARQIRCENARTNEEDQLESGTRLSKQNDILGKS